MKQTGKYFVVTLTMAEYKIKDIELLTGIKAHTLRIWEKRYNLLTPSRTDTQIRTYTDEELVLLLNIAMLNKHGLKISRIAEMSQHAIAEKVAELASDSGNDTEIEQLIIAMIHMDEQLFRDTLAALIRQHGLTRTYQLYVITFLERIGVMWLVGSITAAQEHFISNLIRQRVITEIELLPTPNPNQHKALLFLPEHEWHELGLLLYQYHLRERGVYTVYLGQSMPYSSLVDTIRTVKPTWLVTSWLTAVDEKYIHHYFERLRTDAGDLKILASGFQVKQHESAVLPFVIPFHSILELDHEIQ